LHHIPICGWQSWLSEIAKDFDSCALGPPDLCPVLPIQSPGSFHTHYLCHREVAFADQHGLSALNQIDDTRKMRLGLSHIHGFHGLIYDQQLGHVKSWFKAANFSPQKRRVDQTPPTSSRTERTGRLTGPLLTVAESELSLKKHGLSPTEAIRMFYTQIALRNGLLFKVRIPNLFARSEFSCLGTIVRSQNLSSSGVATLSGEGSIGSVGSAIEAIFQLHFEASFRVCRTISENPESPLMDGARVVFPS